MNVTWDSPSKDATGSMPLCGGNLGLNVWVEGDDLLFYIGSPDSRVEDEKLVKLGRLRLSPSSSPFRKNFRQELDLEESCIRISGEGMKLLLWVDAFQPVVHVEMEANEPVTANIAYESWRFATLFNGGIHTFDNPLPDTNAFGAAGPNPDERAWWGCHFMAQNQRLVYWPMLKAGDFDMLDVGLNFYRDRAPIAQAKAQQFLSVDGTLFTESLDVFGLIAATPSQNGFEAAGHLTYHFTSGLEFAYMMLEECRFTGREANDSLPVIMGMLMVYDNFYQQENRKRTGQLLDEHGKLVIFPGNSCEMGV